MRSIILSILCVCAVLTAGESPVALAPAPGSYKVAVPVVPVVCLSADERLVYTVDGTQPSASSWPLTCPVLLTDPTTLRVALVNAQGVVSRQTSGSYVIAGILTTAKPIANPAAGAYPSAQQVTLTCPTRGAIIRYTLDGSDPTPSSPRATGPVVIATSSTLRARAFGGQLTVQVGRFRLVVPAMFPSGVMTGVYVITGQQQVAAPLIAPASGDYRTVLNATATTTTPTSELRYRLDGADPSPTDAMLPAGGVTIDHSLTLAVRGFRSGWTPSLVARAAYTLRVPEPTITPAGGLTNAPFTAVLTIPPGATVRYATDGSDPVATSPVVSGPITVDRSMTIRAQAERAGWTNSAIAVAVYTLNLPPVITAGPTALPNPVTGTTATVVVVATDDGNPAQLVTTWSAADPTVSFSNTGPLQATATFTAAGSYTLQAVVGDPTGLTATASASVTVAATATSVFVTPATTTVAAGETMTFAASVQDQFGQAVSPLPPLTWSLVPATAGTISNGVMTVAANATDSCQVRAATMDGIVGVAMVQVGGTLPVVTSGPTATVHGDHIDVVVTATGTGLRYAWSATGPGSVVWTGADLATARAVVSGSGTYQVQVVVTDVTGRSVTAAVQTVVAAQPTTVIVTPETATVRVVRDAVFSAMVGDQFGIPMPSVPVVWSASGGGQMGLNGVFAATTAGTWQIHATAEAATGSATVTVTPNLPPTIITPPSAATTPVRMASTTVSIVADDDGGADALRYTWERISGPDVAFDVANGTPQAAWLLLTPHGAGTLVVRCVVRDPEGAQASSAELSIPIESVPTRLRIAPITIRATLGEAVICTAVAVDQFGQALAGPTPITWSTTLGSIDATGRWVSYVPGAGEVVARSGELQGSIAATVSGGAFQVAQAAWADPAIVHTRIASLHVRGTDSAGEAALTYAWDAKRIEDGPGEYTFRRLFGASQGTYAARDTQIEFTRTGTYRCVATIANPAGLQLTSEVLVQVVGDPQILRLNPVVGVCAAWEPATVSAAVIDQFDGVHTVAGVPQWSVTGGSITPDGLRAVVIPTGTTQTVTVTCSLGGYTGTATWNVVSAAFMPQLSVVASKTTLIEDDPDGRFGAAYTNAQEPAQDLTDFSGVPSLLWRSTPYGSNGELYAFLSTPPVNILGHTIQEASVDSAGVIHLGDPWSTVDNPGPDSVVLVPFGAHTDMPERVDGGIDDAGNLAIRFVNAPLLDQPDILVSWQAVITHDGRVTTRVSFTRYGNPTTWYGSASTGLWTSDALVTAFNNPWQTRYWPSVGDIVYGPQPDPASSLTLRVSRATNGPAVRVPVELVLDPPWPIASLPSSLRIHIADGSDVYVSSRNGRLQMFVPFAEGQMDVVLQVTAVEDWLTAGTQIVTVLVPPFEPLGIDNEYTYLVGTPSSQTFTIRGVDRINPPGVLQTISVNGGTAVTKPEGVVRVGEGSAPTTLAFSLNTPLTAALAVTYRYESQSATLGSDIAGLTGTVSVPAGTTSFAIPIAVVNDTVVEPQEQCTLVLTSALSANPLLIPVIILDDDVVPLVTMSGSMMMLDDRTGISTSGGFGVSPILGRPLQVSLRLSGGTAEVGVDYAAGDIIATIPTGASWSLYDLLAYVPVLPRPGRSVSRTVELHLVPGTDYTIDAQRFVTITILDADNTAPPSLAFAASTRVGVPVSVNLGAAFVDPDGDPVRFSYVFGALAGLDPYTTRSIGPVAVSAAGIFTCTPSVSGTFVYKVETRDEPPSGRAKYGHVEVTLSVHSPYPHTIIARPDPFDAPRWASDIPYRTTYLASIIPGRVWLSADPGATIPILTALSEPVLGATPNQNVTIRLQGAPGAPISLTCLGSGYFPINNRNAITVLSDATGVAAIEFRTQNAGDAPLLAASPMASGRIRFLLEVRP